MSVDRMLAEVDRWLAAQEAALEQGAQTGAALLAAAAQATNAHGDQTGATRAGYTAYVATPDSSGDDAVDGAAAAVEEKNPGRSELRDEPVTQADHITVVLTCPTDYQWALEIGRGGASAVIGPTMDAQAAAVHAAIVAALREVV